MAFTDGVGVIVAFIEGVGVAFTLGVAVIVAVGELVGAAVGVKFALTFIVRPAITSTTDWKVWYPCLLI